jgi:hypothetical protein
MHYGARGKPKRVRKRTRSAVQPAVKRDLGTIKAFDAMLAKIEANAAELEERISKIQAQLTRNRRG